MEYTILILALPVLSFLILGLTGMYMKHRTAGWIGTLSLAGVTVLSYLTAFKYFTTPRTAEGIFLPRLRGTSSGFRLPNRFILIWGSCLILFQS